MNNAIISVLTLAVVIAIAALFALNFSDYIPYLKGKKYLNEQQVQGMAVEHNRLLYTLNFDQQNQMIELINASVPTKEKQKAPRTRTLQVQKIFVYPFGNNPIIEILPVDYDDEDNLIFSAPQLYSDGLIQDTSGGEFKKLLALTYDQ